MPFQLIEGDLTKITADVIVNAANKNLQMGGGVCGAIFKAAGPKELQQACNEIGHCETGQVVMTDAFQLNAKKIMHTVGPVWQGGGQDEAELLKSCYEKSLQLATNEGYESIAFPLISAGIYGYPVTEAFQIAVSTIHTHLEHYELHVMLVLLDKKILFEPTKMASLETYLERHLSFSHLEKSLQRDAQILESQQIFEVRESLPKKSDSVTYLAPIIEDLEASFADRLMDWIDQRGMTDAETYKKANIDRRLFSKIRNTPNYTPTKKTVLAFAVALELTLEDTERLLESAGYALSKSQRFDMIIRYFLEQRQYDIYKINEALFSYDEITLGS